MRSAEKILFALVIISLISLLITILSFYTKTIPVEEQSFPLFIPTDCNEENANEYRFSTCQTEKTISKKRKMRFTLDENREDNKRKMDIIKYEALKLKYTEDTSIAILITLTNETYFGEFVTLIKMCENDKQKHFAFWNDKFMIFYESPRKKQEIKEIPLVDL